MSNSANAIVVFKPLFKTKKRGRKHPLENMKIDTIVLRAGERGPQKKRTWECRKCNAESFPLTSYLRDVNNTKMNTMDRKN
jgi:hypothetical protein